MPDITVTKIGTDDQPIVVIDDFFPDAEALRAFASNADFVPALNLYPGVRAVLPDDYWSLAQIRTCQIAIAKAFNLSGSIDLIDASFSIVTTAPSALNVGQCLPHADAFSPRHIALVHYLSHDTSDGTAFYRHRSTGLQSISERDRATYFQHLDDDLRRYGPPPRDYIRGDTEMFDQLLEIDGKFNRAILYRGQQLHSGAIGPHTTFAADPLQGRLTITAFMTVT